MASRLSHIVGFDDSPFPPQHRGNVTVIGTVFAAERLDGVLAGKVRRDGVNSTRVLAGLVNESRFAAHLQAIMLQGVALAGFNVVDVPRLAEETGLPVLVVARRAPDMERIRTALLTRVPGGARKWELIRKLDPMEPLGNVFVQRVGMDRQTAADVIQRFSLHSHVPEPLRSAHLIAGALSGGSRQRV